MDKKNRGLVVANREIRWHGKTYQPGDEFDVIELEVSHTKAKQLFATNRIVYGDIKSKTKTGKR